MVTMNKWRGTAVIAGPFIILSAISAAGSLVLARTAQNPELLEARARSGLAEGAAQEHLGGTQRSLHAHAPVRPALMTEEDIEASHGGI